MALHDLLISDALVAVIDPAESEVGTKWEWEGKEEN